MMTALEIKREIKDVIVRQAAASGVEVDSYATSLLESAAKAGTAATHATTAKDMVELFAPLRGLNLDFERDRYPGWDTRLWTGIAPTKTANTEILASPE